MAPGQNANSQVSPAQFGGGSFGGGGAGARDTPKPQQQTPSIPVSSLPAKIFGQPIAQKQQMPQAQQVVQVQQAQTQQVDRQAQMQQLVNQYNLSLQDQSYLNKVNANNPRGTSRQAVEEYLRAKELSPTVKRTIVNVSDNINLSDNTNNRANLPQQKQNKPFSVLGSILNAPSYIDAGIKYFIGDNNFQKYVDFNRKIEQKYPMLKPVAQGVYSGFVTQVLPLVALGVVTPTTQEGVLSLVKQGIFIPESKTTFLATTKNLPNEMTGVNILSRTEIGKNKVMGISQQVVKQGGEESLSVGRQYIVGKNDITKSVLIGKSQEMPVRLLNNNNLFTSLQDLGEGASSRVVSKETARISNAGKSLPIDKAYKTSYVTSVTKPIRENLYGLIGETKTATSNYLQNPNIKGFIFTEPVIEDAGSVISSSGNTLSKQTSKAISQNVASLTEQATKNIIQTATKPTIISKTSSAVLPLVSSMTENKPTYSQGAYTGLGLYEKTNEKADIIQNTNQSQNSRESNTNKLIESPSQTQPQRNIQLNIPSTGVKDVLANKSALIDTSSQVPRIDQAFRQGNPTIPRENYRTPTTDFNPVTTSLSSKSKRIKELVTFLKGYNVYSRRFGRNILIAENIPKNRATLLGETFAKKTLARSFKLVESGKNTNIADINYNPDLISFRPSKTMPGFNVQKNALSSRTEVNQLISSKKKKGGIKWL